MDDVAESQWVRIRRIGHTHLAHRTLERVAGTGRAVVVEEVVAVHLVLGLCVPHNQPEEQPLLLRRQVQFLLPHRMSLIDIARHEEVRRLCPQLIVRLTLHKTPDKVLRAIVEQPVVEHKVKPLQLLVPHMNGGMAEQRVRFSTRRTRQQGDVDVTRVHCH